MKNKKKMLVIALLLFAAIGFAGYGVYSYYYTQGSFDTQRAEDENSDNVIRITGSFKPNTDAGNYSGMEDVDGFFDEGGMVSLDCPDNAGFGTITCSGHVTVYNEGSTNINVSYSNISSSASAGDSGYTVTTDSLSFGWAGSSEVNPITISPDGSHTLNFTVDVNISNSDQAQLVTDPVSSSEITAYVRFKLEAVQAH